MQATAALACASIGYTAKHMRVASWIVRNIARRLTVREWEDLRSQLNRVRGDFLNDPGGEPAWMAQAMLISGEDHRFFGHGGVDAVAVCRAVWRGVVLRRREGASTIEM